VELAKLIGEREYTDFLNPRNELYRRNNMKSNLPPRNEAIRMMSQEPNLIRRPVIIAGKRAILGFDEKAIETL
jgi:arsenate reductase-like glutaredoxin family protein